MRKIVTALTVLLLGAVLTYGQSRVISGQVKDDKGNPVPFATVKVKGNSGRAVSADQDGNFKIDVGSSNALIFSASGFDTKEASVSGSTVSVVLNNAQGGLQEVVVTALGQTQSKAKLGYSTTTFSNAAITRTAPVGMLDGLAGKIAGADISNQGGPGSSTKVVLRGYGVIGGGNNQPLYVIDGVPLSDASPISPNSPLNLNGNIDFGNGMSSVNPNDIENITVLKGTAASSLYGSLAKNGVIMITTKRGKGGKLRIDYSGSANFSYVGKMPTMQDQYGQGWGAQFILSENGSWGPKLDGKMRPWGSLVDNSQLVKPFSFIDDNIRNVYDVGTEYNNTIALSGGSATNRFYFSYGNVSSNGVIPTDADMLQRNSLALRTNSTFDKFTINTSLNYVNRRMNAPYTGQGGSDGASFFEELLQIPVDIPIRDFKAYKNKFFNVDNYFTPYAENPYYALNENKNTQTSDRFFGNVDMSYKFNNHWTAEFRLGGDFTNARSFGYKQVNAPRPGSWNAGANPEGASRAKDVGSVLQGSDYFGLINGDFLVKYNANIGNDWTVDATAGLNYYQADQKNIFTQITNLVIPGFFNLSNSSAPPTTNDYQSHRKRIGAYGQVTFGWKDEVFLSGNVRNDWSSTLPIDNNSFFYPGANVSWVASKTLDLSRTPISFWKLRAGYGQTGSDADPYLVYPTLVKGTVAMPFGTVQAPFNGTPAFAVSNVIGNPNLQPVKTSEFEFGTEIRFVKNRFGIDATYYDKTTKGQVLQVPISPGTGYTRLVQNLGEVTNKGIELTIDGKIIDNKDFTWAFTYTYSKNWNKVVSLNSALSKIILNDAYDAELDAVPGKPVGAFYAPVPKIDSATGKIVTSAETGFSVAADDKGYYGTAQRDYMMGLINTFTYKDWSLNFSLDYRKGGVMYSGTSDLLLFTGNAKATLYNDRQPFIIPNSVNEVSDGNGHSSYVENTTYIPKDDYYDYWYPTKNKGLAYYQRIFDKSFLKLRDVTLSYRLPQAYASKIKASNIAISVYGRNFLLWTPKANMYVDPEGSNQGNDLAGELGEFRAAPLSKQYGVALKISF